MAQIILRPLSDSSLAHNTTGSNGYSVLSDSSDSTYIYQSVTSNNYVTITSSFTLDTSSLANCTINSVTALVRAQVTSDDGAKVDYIQVTGPTNNGKYNDTPEYNSFTDYSITLGYADLGLSSAVVSSLTSIGGGTFSIATKSKKSTRKKADFECQISEFYIIVDYTIAADTVSINFKFGAGLVRSTGSDRANDNLTKYHAWAYRYNDMSAAQQELFYSTDRMNASIDMSYRDGTVLQTKILTNCQEKTMEGIPIGDAVAVYGENSNSTGFGQVMRWSDSAGNLITPATYQVTALMDIQTNRTIYAELYDVAQVRLHLDNTISAATATTNYTHTQSLNVTEVDTVNLSATAINSNPSIQWTIGQTTLSGASISGTFSTTTTETTTENDSAITYKYIDIYVTDLNANNNTINQIYIGNTHINDLYVGNTKVSAVYIGTTKIYG